MLRIVICNLNLLLFAFNCFASALCPLRNLEAANRVGRPCRKNCAKHDNTPFQRKCKGDRYCECDHECGYSCIKQGMECARLPNIRFMSYINITRGPHNEPAYPPYLYNDKASYVCQPGFKVQQPVVHWCHGRRGWTNGRSVCVRDCLPRDPYSIPRYNLNCRSECVHNSDCGDNEECLCDGSCGRTCVNPNVDCGEAPPAPNTTIQYTGQGFNRVAHYICEEGFYLHSGSSSRKCTGGGTYDGPLPQCRRIECGNPFSSIDRTGGYIDDITLPPFYVGHQLIFACSSSYRLRGSANRTCLNNGQWSGVTAACDLNDGNTNRCPNPGVPVNGYVVSDSEGYNVGSAVEFECKRGYAMVGERRQECLFFLQWSGGGAPKCIDPKYSDTMSDVLQKLKTSTDRIKATLRPQVGRFISAGHAAGHEIYFLIDLSQSVNQQALNNSLTFCLKLIERLQANATGKITYGVMVFASNVKILISPEKVQTVHTVKNKIKNVYITRAQLKAEIGSQTATYKVLDELRYELVNSYVNDQRDGKNHTQRHIFIVTDGRHNVGPRPQTVVDDIVVNQFPENPPQFYSITSCQGDCQAFQSTEAYEELLGLALNEPKNFIKINDFYSIQSLLDQVTDAQIDYSACGVAGEVGSVKNQARLNVGRILGGIKAADRAWPWQVVVSIRGANIVKTFSRDNLKGGGSLINNKWVLTAAHLFSEIEQDSDWESHFLLTFGLHTRPKAQADTLNNIVRVYQAAKILLPDEYNVHTYHFDVALVKVGAQLEFHQRRNKWISIENSGFIDFTEHIRPVCLPCMNNCVETLLRKNPNAVGLNGNETEEERCRIESQWLADRSNDNTPVLAVVTGFGHVEEMKGGKNRENQNILEPSNVLKQGLIKLRSNNYCNKSSNTIPWTEGFDVPFTSTMSCATSGRQNEFVDACKGDSGGPVVREVLDEGTGRSCWVQLGIVSWGWGCGQTYVKNGQRVQYPGYHTDVASVIPWIKGKLSEEEAAAS